MSTVLTVILNWRTPDMTLRSASAALAAMAGIDGALVIVDNASGDGSAERMAAEVVARGWDKGPHRVRVLEAGHNGGFGAGNNLGIRAGLPGGARPDYIYVLNSDAFPDKGAIRALVGHLDSHPATGFAGSLLYGEDGQEQCAAFRFPSIPAEFEAQIRFGPVSRLLHRYIVAQPMPAATRRVDWVSGASLMMRQRALNDIGLFDETYFLYFEETDLCRRAASAGWGSDFVRESRVLHLVAASTGQTSWRRTPRYWLDSRLHYFTKNHGPVYAGLATLSHLAGGLAWQLRLLVQHKDRGDPPYYLWDMTRHAVRAGLTGLRSNRPDRAKQFWKE